jgi:hypothetical protein
MAVRLFVGNLPYDVTEAELRAHFAAIGPLSYLSLATDRDTGKPRGFAFVEFSARADAELFQSQDIKFTREAFFFWSAATGGSSKGNTWCTSTAPSGCTTTFSTSSWTTAWRSSKLNWSIFRPNRA